jgi:hypothetical protein
MKFEDFQDACIEQVARFLYDLDSSAEEVINVEEENERLGAFKELLK